MKRYKKFGSIFAIILLSAGMVQAAPFSQTFKNDFETDSIYLFITAGAVDFVKWQKIPKYWDIGYEEADRFSISGPAIGPDQRFKVKFSEKGTFTLEWAELLNGIVMGSGSLYAVNGKFTSSDNQFSSTRFSSGSGIPTPATGPLWLLGSGFVCLFCLKRSFAQFRIGNTVHRLPPTKQSNNVI